MEDIIPGSLNIVDFVMTVEVWSPDNPVALAQALPFMKNLERVGLTALTTPGTKRSDMKFPKSQAVGHLLTTFVSCMENH